MQKGISNKNLSTSFSTLNLIIAEITLLWGSICHQF